MTSSKVGGDDGAFYFPYILDPQSSTAMLVGTCRVWRGPRTGGAFTALSPNFDTLGSGTCSGSEVNQVRALAAGGPTDTNGSQVIYATTSGNGPLDGPLSSPTGGRVWVTTNATAGIPRFADVTNNGPQGNINPNQFPISSVAIDPSDSTGATAYVTVMGFTGGAGHVWKTTNAGAAWTDFTANLYDAPVNAIVLDPVFPLIYVGTDVGAFVSSTSSPNWTELGSNLTPPTFLPNVAVTALAIFNSGGQELLRASTYGRGIWQYPLATTPDFQLSIPTSTLTDFSGQATAFSGTASALYGYANLVTLSCVAGATAPPTTCTVPQSPLIPVTNTPFDVTVGGADGDYNFNVQGVGADPNHTTHQIPVTLHIVSFALTTPSPSSVTVSHGTTSALVNFQVTAAGSFNQSVTVSCNAAIANSTCTLTPGTSVNPTSTSPVSMTASVFVPAATPTGAYAVTIQATTAGSPATVTTLFTLNVTTNPDFVLSEPSAFPEVNAGSTGTTGPISISSQDGFSGAVTLSCPATFGANSCSISPTTVNSFPATATLTINGTSFALGTYSLSITGTSGSAVHSVAVPFNVGDYSISGTQAFTLAPGAQAVTTLTFTSSTFYSGKINATCDASALPGAMCTFSPANSITVASRGTANLTVTINVPSNAFAGAYSIPINTQDTTGAPSHSFPISLTVAQDFLLTSSTSSQTVTAGQTTGPYNLLIQPVGTAFNASVTLSCSGLPALTQCQFSPSSPEAPPFPKILVMTISTTAATTALNGPAIPRSLFYALWLLLPGMVVAWGTPVRGRHKRKLPASTSIAVLLLWMFLLSSCGGVSAGGSGGGHPGTPPGNYNIKVTGTSPGAPSDAGQSTQVTLVVN